MRAFVAVTDRRWYEFLRERPDLPEINFWRPGGGSRTMNVISSGEPMLFKSHHPHDKLVGGGFLTDYRRVPVSVAWEAFGEGNGASSLEDMRRLIGHYRAKPIGDAEDPEIGCIMLRDVTFFDNRLPLVAPQDFAPNIVSGKGYRDLNVDGESPVERTLRRLIDEASARTWPERSHEMFGTARQVRPRLGQDSFRAVVTAAYRERCAVTGAKILPALQAAHIRPVTKEGQHLVANGLLLRADVHLMFDNGYLGVDKGHRLHVSSRLRSRFGNGEEFYSRSGEHINLPDRRSDRPAAEFLEWHMDEVFVH